MTKRKFYKSKEFLKLQNQWYDKLKKEGFDDIEWYDTKSGLGAGSPYLKNSTGYIRQQFSPEKAEHFSLFTRFLSVIGSFASKSWSQAPENTLKRSPKASKPQLSTPSHSPHDFKARDMRLARRPRSLKSLLSTNLTPIDDKFYTHILSIHDLYLMRRYIEGETYRDIRDDMCSRFPRARLRFSIFWISKRLEILNALMLTFHYKHPEGNYYDSGEYDALGELKIAMENEKSITYE